MADSSSSDAQARPAHPGERRQATFIGLSAVLLWSVLALLTIGSAPVPPLLLNAICFGIGGAVGLVWTWRNRSFHRLRDVPLGVYAFGTAALFAYHMLYFSAFRLSPTAETGLIVYLWPLLIVLGSALLPGERLRAGHVAGALVAFTGAALIILGRSTADVPAAAAVGQILAFGCALTWAVYSLVSRRFGRLPTESVVVFCLATALLAGTAHLLLETTRLPQTAGGWFAIVMLGVGPVGIAFYTWDFGMKRGDIQLLGVASYAAPLLSTLALVLAGISRPSWTLGLAALLIAGGAIIAARAGRRGLSEPKDG